MTMQPTTEIARGALGLDGIPPDEQIITIAILLAAAYRMKDMEAVTYLLRKNAEAVSRMEDTASAQRAH